MSKIEQSKKRSFNLMIYGEKAIAKLESLPRSKRGKYVSEIIENNINSGLTDKQKEEVINILNNTVNINK